MLTGVSDFAGEHHHTLLIFAVNPLHNVIHLVLGIAWLAAAPRHRTARLANLVIGVVLGLVTVLGFVGGDRHARHVRPRRPGQLPAPGHGDAVPLLRVGAAGGTGARPPDVPAGVTCATTAALRNTGGTCAATRGAEFTAPKQGGTPRKQDDGTVNATSPRLRDGGPTPHRHRQEVAVVNTGDTAWILTSAALVLLMTPGLALFYGGMVRAKSVLNMMMMSFGALALISVLWVALRLLARLRQRRRRRPARQPGRVLRPQGPDGGHHQRGRRPARPWRSSPSRRSSRSSPSR